MLSCDICKISKNTFFYRTPLVAASENPFNDNRSSIQLTWLQHSGTRRRKLHLFPLAKWIQMHKYCENASNIFKYSYQNIELPKNVPKYHYRLYVPIMSHTSFRVNPHSIVCLNVKELFARSRRHIWSLSDSNATRFESTTT